jgi:hypothetical protein
MAVLCEVISAAVSSDWSIRSILTSQKAGFIITKCLNGQCKKNKIDHYIFLRCERGKTSGTQGKKEHVKIRKLQSLAVKCCTLVQCGKYSPAKFSNFVLICIPHGKMHHI